MLRTVDDHFAALITKLRELHQLRKTLIIYVSDNGYLFGEHGLWGKSVPYFEAVNVPMMIRFPDRRSAGTVDRRHAQNIDLAPTIRAATGIHPTLIYPYDGRSLLSQWRRPVVLNESFHVGAFTARNWQPSWRSITTSAYQYVESRQHGKIIAASITTAQPTHTSCTTFSATQPPRTTQTLLRSTSSFAAGRAAPDRRATDPATFPQGRFAFADVACAL